MKIHKIPSSPEAIVFQKLPKGITLCTEAEHSEEIHFCVGAQSICGKTCTITIAREDDEGAAATCPVCIAEICYRVQHPEAAALGIGVLAHLQEKIFIKKGAE
ncbi:MAG TPA: hypothetical protein VMU07_01780 [Candidatus Paceibacterota bacterium]|nr:hypothetical protein [Candidatus Paceibacterota bacterium]